MERFSLSNLIGDGEVRMMDRIIGVMENQKDLGLVFPDDPGCLGWTKNKEIADRISLDLKLSNLPDEIDFPVGTMFWARSGALSKLYKRDYKWEDYPKNQ